MVMPYVQYPNMMDAAIKGLQLGSAIGKLPQQAKEEATQMAAQGVAKTQLKYYQKGLNDIIAGKQQVDSGQVDANGKPIMRAPTPGEITQQVMEYSKFSPVEIGAGGGATYNPLGTAIGAQQYQRGQQDIEVQRGQNPGLYPPPAANPPPANPPVVNPPPQQPGQRPRARAPAAPPPPAPTKKSFTDELGFYQQPQPATQLAYGGLPAASFLQNQLTGGIQPASVNMMSAPVSSYPEYYG
jgi:hypothetical protein